MAITFINQTVCSLCGKELKSGERIISLPAFVQNTKDPFYQFNDSAFHAECLQNHPLGVKAIKFSNQFVFSTRPENRICSVGQNVIQDFNDYIFIDLLTSDEQEQLYKFNFTTLDRRNLEKWSYRDDFLTSVEKFKSDGKWGDVKSFKYLDNLIEKIGRLK